MVTPDQINAVYLNRLGRPADPSGLQTYSSFNTPADVDADILQSPEYSQRRTTMLNAQTVQPVTGTDLSNLQNTVMGYNGPLLQAFNQGTQSQQALNNNNEQATENALRTSANQNIAAGQQDLSNRGFLRSGEQIGQNQYINNTLNTDIDSAKINNQINNANLALQNAGFQSDFYNNLNNQVNTLAQQEFARNQSNAQAGQQNYAIAGNLNSLEAQQPFSLASSQIGNASQIANIYQQLLYTPYPSDPQGQAAYQALYNQISNMIP